MQNTISDVVVNLGKILKKDNIDWNLFDEKLKEIEDINIFDEKYEQTILTELLHKDRFYKNGALMPEVIKHFLVNGYDVLANEGANGGLALSTLCWSCYDKYVLESAKVLFDAGAPLEYKSSDEDDEFAGVIGSLEWKIPGAWGPHCNYAMANTLEAYYAMAKAYEAEEDYKDIDSFHKCIGEIVTKVSYSGDVSGLKTINNTTEFGNNLVMWFGDYPLVISNYMDMVVNPLFVRKNEGVLSDISKQFDRILGAKLIRIKYLDSITCYLEFDNGYRVMFSTYDIGDRKRNGLFEIIAIDTNDIKELEILGICKIKGKTYASHVVEYEEEVLTLICKDGDYCIFPDESNIRKYSIGLIRCSKELMRDYVRKFPLSEITETREFRKKGNLVGLRFKCKEGYLYIKTNEYYQLEILLSQEKFNPNDCSYLCQKKEVGIHMEFSLIENKD
ncbi:MAG: hypothetical protein IJ423_01735 [Clostridia bacterium]|nr:hypothetical protein [Clostridia bacterium]